MPHNKTHIDANEICPCGAPNYASCCGRFLSDAQLPPSAALLMRSRYSAYVLEDEIYLQHTWHPSTRPTEPIISTEPNLKWLGLEIRDSQENENSATVEFVARYKINGRAHRLHEVSRFVREPYQNALRWFYVDGVFPNKKK